MIRNPTFWSVCLTGLLLSSACDKNGAKDIVLEQPAFGGSTATSPTSTETPSEKPNSPTPKTPTPETNPIPPVGLVLGGLHLSCATGNIPAQNTVLGASEIEVQVYAMKQAGSIQRAEIGQLLYSVRQSADFIRKNRALNMGTSAQVALAKGRDVYVYVSSKAGEVLPPKTIMQETGVGLANSFKAPDGTAINRSIENFGGWEYFGGFNVTNGKVDSREGFLALSHLQPKAAAGGEIPPGVPTPSECEPPTNRDPLVIDFKGDGVHVSSEKDGVIFDLFGNGSPKRVAWLTRPDDMFVTLPKKGHVDGIHELFGNDTIGPDGKTAANGFEALAKYDENGDDFIDAKDSVFGKLRLWSDMNRDGKAQRYELYPLSRLGLRSIDLNYVEIFEEDIHGNQTRQRSVVHTGPVRRQAIRPVYDVWFRFMNP